MLKVIVVDDNVRTADGLAAGADFASVGFECVGVAYNGRQALELVRQHRPHAVITDVRMPQMDGLELTRCLREEFPGIAILIVSAYDEFDYARQAIDLGVGGYLLKPLDDRQLVSLRRFLSDLRDRIERLSVSLSSVSDARTQEQLAACIRDGDPSGARALAERVVAEVGTDYGAARQAAAALVKALHDHASRQLPADHNPTRDLGAVLARVHGESSVSGLRTLVGELAASVCAAAATVRDFASRHLVSSITTYLDQHLVDSTLSASSVCERFHVSPSYLYQVFRRYLGTTLHSYLTLARLTRAETLLNDRTLSVAEVATRCGFADPHYFSRVFRKLRGSSPAEYRRRLS